MFGEVCWLNATDEMMHKTSNGLYSNNGRVSSSNITRSIECLCFVFKSALLLAVNDKLQKRRKYSKNFERGSSTTRNSTTAYVSVYRVIPMDELKVSGDDVSSKNNDKFVWIIIHRPNASSMERIYYLSNRRLEVKLQFLKSVKKAQQLLNKSCSNNNVPRTELCPAVLCSSTKNISRSSNLHSSNTISAEYSPANNNYYPIIRSSTDKNVSHRSSQSDTGYGGSLSDLHKRISYD
uniref:Tiam1/2 second PH-like domain-containing protein n=1 Tax=Romanomermis culicivorax TaxID=13658 RepID=A0A915L1Y6_ROMCU